VRVISLLPAATEIVAALGAGGRLVGVTHECDYPPEVRSLPRVTRSRLDPGLSSSEIDRAMADARRTGVAAVELDAALVARLRPDVIIGQAVCDVCAVGEAELGRLVTARGRPGRRQRAGRALGAALVAGAERVGPRRRTSGAVRLRRRPGAPRRGSGRGPRREGGAGSPRRVSRRQRLYFTPGAAARRRGGNSRAVDTRLTVSPMLVEAGRL